MDEDIQRKVLWIVAAIIVSVIGVLTALVGPNMLLYYLYQYHTTHVFLIDVPILANILLGVGALLIVAFCLFMIFDKKLFKGIGILNLLIGLALCYASINMYVMLTNSEVILKEPINEYTFEWPEVEGASFVFNETYKETTITFQLPNEREEITLSQDKAKEIGRVKRILSSNGISYEEKEITS